MANALCSAQRSPWRGRTACAAGLRGVNIRGEYRIKIRITRRQDVLPCGGIKISRPTPPNDWDYYTFSQQVGRIRGGIRDAMRIELEERRPHDDAAFDAWESWSASIASLAAAHRSLQSPREVKVVLVDERAAEQDRETDEFIAHAD